MNCIILICNKNNMSTIGFDATNGGGGCDMGEGAIVYMLFLKFKIKYFSS
jgi:hypothetical protein